MLHKKIVLPSKVLEIIEPGMSIFIGTGAAEPRTLVIQMMEVFSKTGHKTSANLENGLYDVTICVYI